MAFLKTGTAPAEQIAADDLDNFTKQAAETCQACGHKMARDEAGELVCRTKGCSKALPD